MWVRKRTGYTPPCTPRPPAALPARKLVVAVRQNDTTGNRNDESTAHISKKAHYKLQLGIDYLSRSFDSSLRKMNRCSVRLQHYNSANAALQSDTGKAARRNTLPFPYHRCGELYNPRCTYLLIPSGEKYDTDEVDDPSCPLSTDRSAETCSIATYAADAFGRSHPDLASSGASYFRRCAGESTRGQYNRAVGRGLAAGAYGGGMWGRDALLGELLAAVEEQ